MDDRLRGTLRNFKERAVVITDLVLQPIVTTYLGQAFRIQGLLVYLGGPLHIILLGRSLAHQGLSRADSSHLGLSCQGLFHQSPP